MTDAELREAAERQLRANLRRGVSALSGKPYSFCVPSNVTYPFQWFWDSCMHAIVWSHIDVEQAKEELLTLLRAQRRNGRIPHRIAWEPPRRAPVLAMPVYPLPLLPAQHLGPQSRCQPPGPAAVARPGDRGRLPALRR